MPVTSAESSVREKDPRDAGVVLYENLRLLIEQEEDPDLELLLQNVERSAVQYTQVADANEHWWRKRLGEGLDAEEMAQADLLERRRTAAHEVLIDSLNGLSRKCRDAGIDNLWRDDIGLERNRVGLWGRKIARHIKNKLLEEENGDGETAES